MLSLRTTLSRAGSDEEDVPPAMISPARLVPPVMLLISNGAPRRRPQRSSAVDTSARSISGSVTALS